MLANEFCPNNVVQQTFLAPRDPFALNWIRSTAAGQAYAASLGLDTQAIAAAPTQACSQGQPVPSVTITFPSSNSTINGTAQILGQVSAGDSFNRYELTYSSTSNPTVAIPIGNAVNTQAPSANSDLGTWNTTTVPNGTYIVRLTAYSNFGGSISTENTVTVQNAEPTPLPSATPLAPILPTAQSAPFSTPLPSPFVPPANNISTPIPFDGEATPTATLSL